MFRFTRYLLLARWRATGLLALGLALGLALAPTVSWNSGPSGGPIPVALMLGTTFKGPVAVGEAPKGSFGPATTTPNSILNPPVGFEKNRERGIRSLGLDAGPEHVMSPPANL